MSEQGPLLPEGFKGGISPQLIRFLTEARQWFGCHTAFGRGARDKTVRLLRDGEDLGYVNPSVLRRRAVFGVHFPENGGDHCFNEQVPSIESDLLSRLDGKVSRDDFEFHIADGSRKPDRQYLVLRSVELALDWIERRMRESKRRDMQESDVLLERVLEQDLERIRSDHTLSVTSRQTLVQARLGQGQFRRDLIERFRGRCAVTGCDFQPLLRASHIKPWSSSDNHERLDPENGLLLVANLDALFDRHLISFTDDGQMIRAAALPPAVLALLGPTPGLPILLSDKQRKYLRHHRAAMKA
jgi:hypothetical protein